MSDIADVLVGVIYKARWVDGIKDINLTTDKAIAEAILAAGFVLADDAKAEAWGEGVHAALDDACYNEEAVAMVLKTNPYLEVAQ